MATEAALALFPRFSTLVSRSDQTTTFTSTPVDVSGFGSAQFQLWRGYTAGTIFKAYLEESLDGESWTFVPGGAQGYDPGQNQRKSFSYAFRLRWFRLRIDFRGEIVNCWAEGVMR
jgi:hypothetical protein